MPEALLIFARAPRAGLVKTRLVPPLSAENAAQLYEAFIRDTARAVEAFTSGRDAENSAIRWYVDGPNEAFPASVLGPTFEQKGDDLGDRMLRACLETIAAGFTRVVIIGTDCPTLPPVFIEKAFRILDQDGGIVLGPSTDGGYYLIGLAKMVPSLFRDMAWSTDKVFDETCRRVSDSGTTLSILPEWYDVDRPDDLDRLRADVEDKDVAPFTSEILANLTI